jgi:hypothetical protein
VRPEWDAETRELMMAFTEMHEAHRSGDVELFSKYVAPMFHEAGADNGLFSVHPEGLDQERVRAAFEGGLHIRWSVQHPEVYFYGSGRDVAVITCYFTGVIASPGGREAGIWRNTSVWTNTGDAWQTVHNHVSPVVIGRDGVSLSYP